MQDKLTELARRAARPARGDVDPQVDAVVFQDTAELLACLGEDWLANRLSSRWWWRDLLDEGGLNQTIVSLWMKSVQFLPATLDRMNDRGTAVRFVRRLSHGDTLTLQDRIIETFGLSTVRSSLEVFAAEAQAVRTGPIDDVFGGYAPPLRPWRSWFALNSADPLTVEQELMLGVALMLVREPSRVRSRAFAQQALGWMRISGQRAQLELINGPKSLREHSELRPDRDPPPPPRGGRPLHVERSGEALQGAPGEDRKNAQLDEWSFETRGSEEALEGVSDSVSAAAPDVPNAQPFTHVNLPDHTGSSSQLASETPMEHLPLHVPGGRAASTVFETGLGGLFYLINIGIFLNLYGDFTTPKHPGIDLSIWDFLTLVGRALGPEPHREDAVWPELAALAGRHVLQEPGAGFEPPDGLPLEKWIDSITDRIGRRLGEAFGMSSTSEAGKLLIEQRARVLVETCRLDVSFQLAAHPIRIRLAGLDRNPGWVPAAGRYIEFHYD